MKFPLLPIGLILAFIAGALTHWLFEDRYRVIAGSNGLVRFDSTNGQTWYVDSQTSSWKLVGEPVK